MKDIEIFIGPGCAQCKKAKKLLKQHGLDYSERDVSEPAVMDEFRKRLPRSKALPQIFADGKHLGSLEDLQINL